MTEIHTAKLFMNGNSQAIRLPKDCRFDGDEVLIHKEGSRLIIQPKKPGWEDFFASKKRPSADFMRDRGDGLPQPRETIL